MAIRVTQEEFNEWLQSNVTKHFRNALREERERMKEHVILGRFDNKEEEQVKGRCAAIAAIADMTYEDLIESIKESYE